MKDSSAKSNSRSTVGAPSQHNQSTRKGKKSWRKNINIEDVEAGLEELRTEERVIGTTLYKTHDSDLFQIDVKGDDQSRRSLHRFSTSQLTSTKILSQRSAVPAVYSRLSSSNKRKSAVSREEKDRLLRIARRPRKGPFNSIMDPSELEAGSSVVGLSKAVQSSGSYDAWIPEPVEEIKDGLETVQKKAIKPPMSKHPKSMIDVPAIVEPHQGISYNPPAEAHQELLNEAIEAEKRRLQGLEKFADTKAKMAVVIQEDLLPEKGLAPGMKLYEATSEDEAPPDEDGVEFPAKKLPARKTTAQKNKAAKHLAEKRALAQAAATKRMLASVNSAKAFRKLTARSISAQERERLQKRLELQEKLKKHGLAGQKLGKHKVPESEVLVQIGEDLSENLRGLKPEGNLFRDRFLSLQQRALIEPRAPVIPKKRRKREIEYEKHAWKRFQ